MRAFLALFLASVLLVMAGCGAQAGSGAAEPASIAPANTLAFASFEIAPQGPEKAGFDAAFGKLLGPDPESRLGQAFTKAASTGGSLDYASDVKPWLGSTVSALVTRVGPNSCDFAVLAASTDDDKAQAAIDKDLAGKNAQSLSYRDVSYKLLGDGTANGIVDHYLVAGTESAFKAVVDTAKDGNSLADSEQWKNSVGDRPNGKVGFAYVDVKGLLQSFAASMPGLARLAGPLLVGQLDLHPFVGTLEARPDALVGDLSSPGTRPDPRGPAAASSPLIESLPADSWLALALPDVGQSLGKLAGALQSNPFTGLKFGQFSAKVKKATGLDLQRDVLAVVGDLGLYVRGTSPRSVHGTLVVGSRRGASSARLLRNGRRALPARAAKRVTLVAASKLHPKARMGDTPLFQKAAAMIGGRPTLLVDFQKALALAETAPHHRNDAHFQKALPHLRHIEYAAAGARRDGGVDVLRGVLGLR